MKRLVLGPLALLALAPTAHAQNPPVTITVDSAAQRKAISPLIYGVHFANAPTLSDLNATVNRFGGNSAGRYNWQQNIDNRGGDYFFESIPYSDPTPGELGDTFIQTSKNGGAEPFLTMPMVGWVAKTDVDRNTLCSFSVGKYGAQTGAHFDCGNGCKVGAAAAPCTSGTPITPGSVPASDPTDASMPADHTFQQGWVQHIKDTFDTAANGGLRFWGFDNEPTIWHSVYWDVHDQPATIDEIAGKMVDYGAMIKAVDPSAEILGPEEWGYDGFFYSGLDQHNLSTGVCGFGDDCPDRAAHGSQDYVPYLLDHMRQYEVDHPGHRILDWLSLHFYPQGGEFSGNTTAAMQNLRNRSTRGLWDPSYVNESYIGEQPDPYKVLKLIPRMRDWVDTYYPGTRIALTEYNWGAENSMNGATAEADLLGIFGREGLDMAIRWVVPAAGKPVYKAFQMYRNYDGAKSTFGDTSVSATTARTSAPGVDASDHVAVFAAERSSDGALTIMVINKDLKGTTPVTINVAGFATGSAAMVWRLAANAITQPPDVPVDAAALPLTLPAQSVTLLVLPSGPTLSVADTKTPELLAGTTIARFDISLSGPAVRTVTVDYATGSGTATAGSDYAATGGTLTFDPGDTTKTVAVTVYGDATLEANETFTLTLSNVTGAAVTRAQAVGTIIDNASVPKLQFSLAGYTVAESSPSAVISVRRAGSLSGTVGVSYRAYDGTAAAPADYAAAGPIAGTLTFASGMATRTFTVPIVNDSLAEDAETILLSLSDPTGGALLGAQTTAVLTIPANDPAGSFSLTPSTLRLSETAGPAVFKVRRTGGTSGTVTVDFATASGSAQDGSDYTGQATTLTFAPGQTLQTVAVPIAADGAPEGEEYFTAALGNPTGGANLGTAALATITITSTDQAVQLLSPTFSVSEGAGLATITAKRTGPLSPPLTVSYATSDGTAVAGVDYTAASGTLSFPAGVVTRTFAVNIVRDAVFKPARTVHLALTGPSVGVLGTSQAVLTIKDDDMAGTVQFSLADRSVNEAAGSVTVAVTRTGKLAAGQTVLFTTSDGSAVAGTNYTNSTQVLTFAASQTSKLVTIPVLDAGAGGSGALSVHLTLGNPTGGAAIGTRAAATLWIVENP
jgi:glycosyl hydrolase family 44/Calx-beta domain-containing protein